MRRFSLFMVVGWWVCAVSSIAQTFTAQWHVTNFVSQATQVKRVTLTPLTPFSDFTNAILDDSPITGQTDTNGVVTFTNLFAGYSYRFELDTLYKKVIRTNGFPVGLNGTVAAEPYTGVWLPGQTIFAYISTNAQQVTYSGGIATSATNLLGSITSAQVSDATSSAIPNTIVKRDANSIFDGTATSALSVPGSGISGSINGAQVTGTVPAASSVPAAGISGVVSTNNGGTGNSLGISVGASNAIALLNVKLFGAKGDGVTDDTAAIQSAINAAELNYYGGIYIPATANNYKITAPLYVTNNPGTSLISYGGGFIIQGDGAMTTVIKQTTANNGIVITNTANTFFYIKLDSITLFGPGYNQSASGIYAGTNGLEQNQWLIQNSMIEGWSNGFIGSVEDITFFNDTFDKCGIAINFSPTGSNPNVNRTVRQCEILVQNSNLPTPSPTCIGIWVSGGTYLFENLDIGDTPMNPCIVTTNTATGAIRNSSFEFFGQNISNFYCAIALDGGPATVEGNKFANFTQGFTNGYAVLDDMNYSLKLDGNIYFSTPIGKGMIKKTLSSPISGSDADQAIVDYYNAGTYVGSYLVQPIPNMQSTFYPGALGGYGTLAANSNFVGVLDPILNFGATDDNLYFVEELAGSTFKIADLLQYDRDSRNGAFPTYLGDVLTATNGATFTDTGHFDTNGPVYAFDGNIATKWWIQMNNPAGSTTNSLTIDYGAGNSNKITSVAVNFSDVNGIDFDVYGSPDNSTWTHLSVYAQTLGNNLQQWVTNSFANATAYRYYKLGFNNKLDGADWMKVYEIQLFGNQLQVDNLLVNKAISVGSTNAAPSNTTTPKLWIPIIYNGQTYMTPLYQ